MVTILLATRITFLTLTENSVNLDVMRITFLHEKSNSHNLTIVGVTLFLVWLGCPAGADGRRTVVRAVRRAVRSR